MTWKDVRCKWWHRLMIAVTYVPISVILVGVLLAEMESVSGKPEEVALFGPLIFAGVTASIWWTYRLILWIIVGRIDNEVSGTVIGPKGAYEAGAETGDEPEDEPEEDDSADAGNYFARHWRGELSLGVSFWVNWWGVAIFVIAVAAMLLPMAVKEQMVGPLYVAFAASLVLITWQLVGVWRSASKHAAVNGVNRYAVIAKAMVVLAIVVNVCGFLKEMGAFGRME